MLLEKKKSADDREKLQFDRFAVQRRRLKEVKGARGNFAALKAVLKKEQTCI